MKISGIVIAGEGIGRTLGFPTVNIDSKEFVRLENDYTLGVYAGFVTVPEGKQYRAGIVVGPLNSEGLPKLEAHLIDYKNSLYGKEVTFHILAFLRPLEEYSSTDALMEAIAADINKIKQMELCLPES